MPHNKMIYMYSDHFLCRKHNKIKMHDHIRNTTHFITSTIGNHTNLIPSKEEYKLEAPNLLPSYPSIRPGDIPLHSGKTPLVNQLNLYAHKYY